MHRNVFSVLETATWLPATDRGEPFPGEGWDQTPSFKLSLNDLVLTTAKITFQWDSFQCRSSSLHTVCSRTHRFSQQ